MTETTLQDKKEGKQLSTKAIQEKMRPYSVEAIGELVKLMQLPIGTNDNVKLGAIKTLLAKVVPDLKSLNLGSEDTGLTIRLVDFDGSEIKSTTQAKGSAPTQ